MKRRAAAATLAASLLPTLVQAQAGLKAAEAARIERLIAAVELRQELSFVRNGRAYNCTDAARFLREKLKAMGGDVSTAEDFIERIASKSSMSGRPYLIRWPDGREQPSADFLRAELKRLDTAQRY